MANSSANITELSERVLAGVKKAVRELIEANAAKNEDMVIADKDGSFKIVPAKELLKGLSK